MNSSDKQAEAKKQDSFAKTVFLATIVGIAVVSFWRGVWYVWDAFTFTKPEDQLASGLASLTTGVVILVLLKKFSSVFAEPFGGVKIGLSGERDKGGTKSREGKQPE